ncbi:tyrosine-type recombinase/integrase [Alishewanella jeotgali]|uniref:Phage integrase n=1 Tax=Alishewanella jeotgali KCTC 22429 TaxID=1129374 RepID=H3ZGJ0_9ALTE|nr:tyrosine-type recombinase/integrase [Alishewanella jeotgali]EHR40302.1 Phage integrase [Alishewanella jeotgali KCTC 22429]
MSVQLERHDVTTGLYIFLQNNSKRWYARFVIDGKWYCKATKEEDKEKAIAKAHRIFVEHQIRFETNTLTTSKRFKDVAEKAIATMKHDMERGAGKVIYEDYIGCLNRYHIPFFDRTFITSIDVDALRAFDKWREEKMKRKPARSTLLTHNAALQLVFKEAVENKWMLASQIPALAADGANMVRRAAFTPAEYERILEKLFEMEENSRKEVTKQIRELTQDYAEFVINTGMRPGTELDNLTWGDLHIERHEDQATFYISVRKGKTTLHTGTREVVCKRSLQRTIWRMTERFPNRQAKDLLFRLPDGSETKEISRTFNAALKELGLDESPHGKRTLYSLRHSFITWELVAQKVTIDVLARQCGTSIEMIERHYSHVIPRMFSQQLSGVVIPDKKEIEKKWEHQESLIKLWKERFIQWEKSYKRKGCI